MVGCAVKHFLSPRARPAPPIFSALRNRIINALDEQNVQEQPARLKDDGADDAGARSEGPRANDAAPEDAEAPAHGGEEIGALRAERDALSDKLLRRTAEFQNYRRRAEEDKGRLRASVKARALQPLLGVVDDFERTIAAAVTFDEMDDAEAAYAALREGVGLVLQKFRDELGRLGIEPIEAKGQPFDEEEHEAVMQQPAPEGTAPGTVLEEVQKGYRMDDGRVLRHSKVVVAAEA